MNKKTLIIFILIFAVAIIGIYMLTRPPGDNTGLNSGQNNQGEILSFTDPSSQISFDYPDDIGTEYISTTDWPPRASSEVKPFSCIPAGEETNSAGKTERVVLGTSVYCKTTVSEGAAGSVYSMYAYAFPKEDQVIILMFGLRAVQCGNYSEEEMKLCEEERESFDIDTLADSIAKTAQFGS